MKLLLVSLYFPPAGGGGVQRPLKFAAHLPSLGIETHVLAPDDPKWIHVDPELKPPTQAWVHRARYIGPRGRKPAEELHGTRGLERASRRARLAWRRALVPDENVSWNLTAIPAAIRIVRAEGIDAVLTTSPPGSVHLVGAAVKRATGVPWVADLRDSLVAHVHRRNDTVAARAKERSRHAVARVVARSADAIVTVSDAIRDETEGLAPRGPVVSIPNGCDFDDFAGSSTGPRRGSGSRTRAASSGGATRGRSWRRCTSRGWTSSSASSATSAQPTASGPIGWASATASSCTRTRRAAVPSSSSATPRRSCS